MDRDGEGDLRSLRRGPGHRSGRGADLLLDPLAVPGAAGGRLAAHPARAVPGDLSQHHQHAARRCARHRRRHDRQRAARTPSPTGATPDSCWSWGSSSSLYSASGAMGASMRSLEAINSAKKGRDFLPNLGVRLGLTVLVTLLVLDLVPVGRHRGSPVRLDRRRRWVPPDRQGPGRLPALADRRGGPARRVRDRLRPGAAPHTAKGGPVASLGPARRGGGYRGVVRHFPSLHPLRLPFRFL